MSANIDEKVVRITTEHSDIASMFRQAGINRKKSVEQKLLDLNTDMRRSIEDQYSENVSTSTFERYLARSSQKCLVKAFRTSDPSNEANLDFSKLHSFLKKQFSKASADKQDETLKSVGRKNPIKETATSSRTGEVVRMLQALGFTISFSLLSPPSIDASLTPVENNSNDTSDSELVDTPIPLDDNEAKKKEESKKETLDGLIRELNDLAKRFSSL